MRKEFAPPVLNKPDINLVVDVEKAIECLFLFYINRSFLMPNMCPWPLSKRTGMTFLYFGPALVAATG